MIFLTFPIILGSCQDDEGNLDMPTLQVESPETIKPGATIIIEVTASAPKLLAIDGITGGIASGEGVLEKTGLSGEHTTVGSAIFEFTAGGTENTSSILEFEVLDELGQTAASELDIQVTALDYTQVVVLNEGNFFSANGTLDVYDLRQQTADNGVYQVNATVQQAVIHQQKTYLVTNAPDALDVLNNQLELEISINQGLDNPIDFAAVDDIGYVSNWGDINTAFSDDPDSFIALIDLNTQEVTDSVLLGSRPQGLLAFDEKIFIALEGGAAVAVLDTEDSSLEEIQVPAGPSEMVVDSFGMIWVICTSGSLVEIDPVTMSVVSTITGLTTGGFNEKMAIDGTGEVIYYLGGSNDSFTGLTTVYQVDLSTQEVSPFVENGFALYGIGVNSETNEVYLGDSNAFQSTGTGFRYNAQGAKLDEFATGIGPRGFLFK